MGKKRIVNGKIVDEPDEPLPQARDSNVFTQQGASSATQQVWPSRGGGGGSPYQQGQGSGAGGPLPGNVTDTLGNEIDVYGYPVKVWQALVGVGAAAYFFGTMGLVGAGALLYFSQQNAPAAPAPAPAPPGPSRHQPPSSQRPPSSSSYDRSSFPGQPRSLSDIRSDSM